MSTLLLVRVALVSLRLRKFALVLSGSLNTLLLVRVALVSLRWRKFALVLLGSVGNLLLAPVALVSLRLRTFSLASFGSMSSRSLARARLCGRRETRRAIPKRLFAARTQQGRLAPSVLLDNVYQVPHVRRNLPRSLALAVPSAASTSGGPSAASSVESSIRGMPAMDCDPAGYDSSEVGRRSGPPSCATRRET